MTAQEWVRAKWGERAEVALLAAHEWCVTINRRRVSLAQFTFEWVDDDGTRWLCSGIRSLDEPVCGEAPDSAKWTTEGDTPWQGPGALPPIGEPPSAACGGDPDVCAGPWTREYLRWVEYTRTPEYAERRSQQDAAAKAFYQKRQKAERARRRRLDQQMRDWRAQNPDAR